MASDLPAASHFQTPWMARGRRLAGDGRPRVMGIVNTTPDSFSEAGQRLDPARAVALGRNLAAEGADILDIGGESSRPGALPVTAEEELRRVLPVVEALGRCVETPISVDTTKAGVAAEAIRAGAAIINDITALAGDPRMAAVVADHGAGVVLMHMQGTPRTMQDDPRYGDVVGEVYETLARRLEWAESRGIGRERIALDPGIGFGKTFEHNLLLLRSLRRFASLGCVVLVGTSRKGFLGTLTGRAVHERAAASVASALAALAGGASVVRVHDVGPTVDALKVWDAQGGWDEPS
jgi:dihydropteroate synthase